MKNHIKAAVPKWQCLSHVTLDDGYFISFVFRYNSICFKLTILIIKYSAICTKYHKNRHLLTAPAGKSQQLFYLLALQAILYEHTFKVLGKRHIHLLLL